MCKVLFYYVWTKIIFCDIFLRSASPPRIFPSNAKNCSAASFQATQKNCIADMNASGKSKAAIPSSGKGSRPRRKFFYAYVNGFSTNSMWFGFDEQNTIGFMRGQLQKKFKECCGANIARIYNYMQSVLESEEDEEPPSSGYLTFQPKPKTEKEVLFFLCTAEQKASQKVLNFLHRKAMDPTWRRRVRVTKDYVMSANDALSITLSKMEEKSKTFKLVVTTLKRNKNNRQRQ